jgi:hypothetical protein
MSSERALLVDLRTLDWLSRVDKNQVENKGNFSVLDKK